MAVLSTDLDLRIRIDTLLRKASIAVQTARDQVACVRREIAAQHRDLDRASERNASMRDQFRRRQN